MAKILVTWLASEVKLGCLSYPYYFEMRDVCECDIEHLYMPLVDELAAIHLVTFCGTVGFRRLKALKSH